LCEPAQIVEAAAIEALGQAANAVGAGRSRIVQLFALIAGKVQFELAADLVVGAGSLELRCHRRGHFVERR
jgi:hypothetical protein